MNQATHNEDVSGSMERATAGSTALAEPRRKGRATANAGESVVSGEVASDMDPEAEIAPRVAESPIGRTKVVIDAPASTISADEKRTDQRYSERTDAQANAKDEIRTLSKKSAQLALDEAVGVVGNHDKHADDEELDEDYAHDEDEHADEDEDVHEVDHDEDEDVDEDEYDGDEHEGSGFSSDGSAEGPFKDPSERTAGEDTPRHFFRSVVCCTSSVLVECWQRC
ncbi:unnamed protein product [Amoebophrya sp. A25]|nr:unnamed protein product [Amoebophrya sp. A25]|eukprot:GSA25T00018856001.1